MMNVPLSVKAVEASSLGISIYRHDPKGKVAQAYAQVDSASCRRGSVASPVCGKAANRSAG